MENKGKKKMGRPTVFTEKVVQKLEWAFAIGASDEEACAYGEISRSSLNNYQNENPEFLDRKHRLKELPYIRARKAIVDNLDDAEFALKYMERKRKDEFSTKIVSDTLIQFDEKDALKQLLYGDSDDTKTKKS